MKDFFETKMLWVVLCFFVVGVIEAIWIAQNTSDFNRTIGWGWDLPNFLWWIGFGNIFYLLLLVNIIGYLALKLLTIKTNYLLSISHAFLLLGSFFITEFNLFYLLVLFIVFALNVVLSLVKLR